MVKSLLARWKVQVSVVAGEFVIQRTDMYSWAPGKEWITPAVETVEATTVEVSATTSTEEAISTTTTKPALKRNWVAGYRNRQVPSFENNRVMIKLKPFEICLLKTKNIVNEARSTFRLSDFTQLSKIYRNLVIRHSKILNWFLVPKIM